MGRARRSYTDEDKAAALALYAEAGPTAVQDTLGVPKATVTAWAKAAGIGTVRNEQTAAATEAARLDWEKRRLEMTHEIGEVAELALSRVRHIIEDRCSVIRHTKDGEQYVIAEGAEAKAYATTMAILIDKAQLLSGAATSRTEHVDRERALALVDELAERRKARAA